MNQGAHQFDGRISDLSESGLKHRATFLHSVVDKASAFTGLSEVDRFERDYLVQVAKGQLFWLEDADQPHSNPLWYTMNGLDPNVYISRNYADKPTRMKAMIAFIKAIPTAAKNIRANLKPEMPASLSSWALTVSAAMPNIIAATPAPPSPGQKELVVQLD